VYIYINNIIISFFNGDGRMRGQRKTKTRKTFVHFLSVCNMSTIPPKMSARMNSVASQLNDVRNHINPLLKLPIQLTLQKMTPLESARLKIALGFAINALFYIFLKTRGENPTEHPVKKELDRVRAYLKKIKATEASIKEKKRKNDIRENHNLKAKASIAFVDSTVAKRTVERTLGIKRRKNDETGITMNSNNQRVSSPKKKSRTLKNIKRSSANKRLKS
jgi:hypothetical protein